MGSRIDIMKIEKYYLQSYFIASDKERSVDV
jgi:hypothetical protein